MSDLHGCDGLYRAMLEKIKFSDDDTLYILGDIVDRGEGGIRILQDLMQRKNVMTLLGNHDDWANRILHRLSTPAQDYLSKGEMSLLSAWLSDGGRPTFDAFCALDAKTQTKVLAYLNSFWLYEELEVGGRRFFLSHTLPSKDEFKNFGSLKPQDFTFSEPDYEEVYDPDVTFITGHTPTAFINPAYRGRIWRGNNHIAVDCGAVFNGSLGCLCLDTMEEYYVNQAPDRPSAD